MARLAEDSLEPRRSSGLRRCVCHAGAVCNWHMSTTAFSKGGDLTPCQESRSRTRTSTACATLGSRSPASGIPTASGTSMLTQISPSSTTRSSTIVHSPSPMDSRTSPSRLTVWLIRSSLTSASNRSSDARSPRRGRPSHSPAARRRPRRRRQRPSSIACTPDAAGADPSPAIARSSAIVRASSSTNGAPAPRSRLRASNGGRARRSTRARRLA